MTAASSSVAPSAPPIVVVVLDDGSALLDACATSRDALYLVRGMAAMGTYTSAQGLGLVVASGGGGSGSGSSTLHTSMSVADVRLAAGFGTMSLHTVASSPALDVAAATGVVEGATARAPSSGGTTRRSSLTASDSTSKLGASVRSVVATVRVFMRFVADADMAVQGSLIADCTPEARVANAPEYATVSYVKYAASLADALVRVAPLPSGYSKDVAGRITLTLRAQLAQSPVSDVRLHSVSMLSAVQREAAPWVPPASRSILFRIADNKIRPVGEPTLGSAPTTTSAAWSATLAKGG
ncbi:hypothetical protein EON67_03105 [archaeon]|nr:MAG: hypothetical protein EON67_03105 [archaeon]